MIAPVRKCILGIFAFMMVVCQELGLHTLFISYNPGFILVRDIMILPYFISDIDMLLA